MTANCIQKSCASLRRACAVALALCIALGALSLPVSARADAAAFVQVSLAGANAYDSANAATILQAGTVLMLQNPVKAAYNGQEYYYVYYNSAVYHILATEVSPISEADAQTYVRNNLWTSTAFTTLKRELNLICEMRVYALQLALKTLGYYSDSLDGSYGKGTEKAVYKFQRANGLSKDGDAGPLTQQALFALARNKGTSSGSSSGSGSSSSGSSSSGTTGTMGTSGTLRTVASVNLREKATQNSTKLASVPVNSVLTYYNTSVSGGVTWYQVLYNNKNGWLMGTYVNVTSSSTGTASGTLTTTAKVNLRKSSSKSSVRLGVVPMGVKLAYIDAKTSGGVTWYKVSYGVNTGWLMGTYVNASGSGSSSGGNSGSGGSSSGSVTVTGKVEITKVSTRVRKTPGGAKTGVVLAKGSVVEMIGASVSSADTRGILSARQRHRLCARRLRHRGGQQRQHWRRKHRRQSPQVHHPSHEHLFVHHRQPDGCGHDRSSGRGGADGQRHHRHRHGQRGLLLALLSEQALLCPVLRRFLRRNERHPAGRLCASAVEQHHERQVLQRRHAGGRRPRLCHAAGSVRAGLLHWARWTAPMALPAKRRSRTSSGPRSWIGTA